MFAARLASRVAPRLSAKPTLIRPATRFVRPLLISSGAPHKRNLTTKMTNSDLFYQVETTKSFEQAAADLEASVKANQFGVLHVHNIGETLRGKGIDFKEDCKVFEVCNPGQAAKVLAADMRLNMALPCRISVFSDKGKMNIGLIKPGMMLSSMSTDPELQKIAAEVEAKTILMIDQAK